MGYEDPVVTITPQQIAHAIGNSEIPDHLFDEAIVASSPASDYILVQMRNGQKFRVTVTEVLNAPSEVTQRVDEFLDHPETGVTREHPQR